MAETSSSKYHHITCKDLIRSGSPAVYQLRPKKDTIGTVSKMTFGDRNPNKVNKTILLVGETGAGKSTLINALVNYAMGVEWEDQVWFQIVEDEKTSQTGSQTSDVIVYEIFGFEDQTLPFSLTIIDTPGYGNTSGIKQDVVVSQRLFDLFGSREGVHQINVVGLVLKATESRLSDRLSYIFDSVVSLFGKDMERNIVALITHSEERKPRNALKAIEEANIKCARDEKNQPVYFLVNNRQSAQKNQRNKAALGRAWDLTTDQLQQFNVFLVEAEPQQLETTVQVLKSHTRLTDCVQNLQERTRTIELKQEEVRQTRRALEKHEEDIKNNKEFTYEVDEVYRDKEPIRGGRWGLEVLGSEWRELFYEGAVTCTVCEETCHYPCKLAVSPQLCEVMKWGRCTSCGCPASDHLKEEWKYVTRTRKVQKTRLDMKMNYEKGKAGCDEKTSVLETLEEDMKKLQAGRKRLLTESFQHVVNLEKIALNVNSASTYNHLHFLIEKMKEKGDAEKVQKLKEMKKRMDGDKRTKAAWWFRFGEAGLQRLSL